MGLEDISKKRLQNNIQKSFGINLNKGRKAEPIGTVRNGRKKVAEGKWVPVKKEKVSGGYTDKEIVDYYNKYNNLTFKEIKEQNIQLSATQMTISKFSKNGNDTSYIKKLIKNN